MEIIEITFENISISNLPNIINIFNNISAKHVKISSSFKESIRKYDILNILYSNQYSVSYNYKNIYIFRNNFSFCFAHIISYNNEIEINLQFNYNELKYIDLKKIINEVDIFSNTLNAETYCCGYEPATDKNTQFFSKNKIGTISW